MGYNLHILRTKKWFYKEQPISLEEWRKYINNSVEFSVANKITTITAFGELSIEGEFAVLENGEQKIYFLYDNGRITVEDPDEIIIKKMKDISKKLKAKVIGDDGEVY